MRPRSDKPRTAVIIPAYNAQKYLPGTLDSVLAQTVSSWELIVVDDGSADETAAIVQDYAVRDRRIRLIQQANAGASAARNRALQEVAPSAETILFLDADDLWEPDALETLSAALEAHPRAVAAHGLARYIDSWGEPYLPGWLEDWGRNRRGVINGRLVSWPPQAPTTFAVLAFQQCIATPGVILIRQAALEAAGPFATDIVIGEDWELWVRLSLQGDLAFVNKVLLGYRQHGSSLSADPKKLHLGGLYARRRLICAPYLDEEQREIACAGYRLYEREMCRTKFDFARGSLAQGQPLQAARQFCRGMRNYLCSVRGLTPVRPDRQGWLWG